MEIGQGVVSRNLDLNGSLDILSGGTVIDLRILSYAFADVSSGGVLSSATVRSGGYLDVSSGGTARLVTVLSGGNLHIDVAPGTEATFGCNGSFAEIKNGVISNQLIENSADVERLAYLRKFELNVHSGGIISSSTLGVDVSAVIMDGGVASDVIVSGLRGYDGYLVVQDGGVASKITIKNDGTMNIYAGGYAENITLEYTPYSIYSYWSGAPSLSIYKGSASNVTADSGFISIHGENTVVRGLEVTSNCSRFALWLASGMEIEGVYDGKSFSVHDGVLSPGFKVGKNVDLVISNGCSALAVDWQPFDGAIANEGGLVTYKSSFSSCYYGSGGTLLERSASYNALALSRNYSCFVGSGGTMTKTIVSSGAQLTILEGGKTTSTTILSSGSLAVESGGIANHVIASSSGKIYVTYGGTLQNATLSGAKLSACYANSVSNVTLKDDASLWGTGTLLKDITISSGAYANLTNCVISGMSIADNGRATLESGTIATGINLTGFYAWLNISSGATAYDLECEPFDGYVKIDKGAVVTYASSVKGCYLGSNNVLKSKTMTISHVRIGDDERIYVINGGKALDLDISSDGYLCVYENGSVAGCVNSGFVDVVSGGSLSSVVILGSGELYCGNGSIGEVTISSGGLARLYDARTSDLSIGKGGSATISGGTVQGRNLIQDRLYVNGNVTVKNASFCMDLCEASPGEDYLIYGMDRLENATFTIRLGDGMANGTYRLADTMTGGQSFTIEDSDGRELAIVARNQFFTYQGDTYWLDELAGNDLVLVVNEESDLKPDLALNAHSYFGEGFMVYVENEHISGIITNYDDVQCRYIVQNIGADDAKDHKLCLYVDGELKMTYWNNALETDDYELGRYSFGKLTSGIHNVMIRIDPDNEILESNEFNNVLYQEIQVINADPQIDFFTPTGWESKIYFTTTPNGKSVVDFEYGETVYLNFALKNSGLTETGTFYVEVYKSGLDERPYERIQIPSIAPGETYLCQNHVLTTYHSPADVTYTFSMDSEYAGDSIVRNVTFLPPPPYSEFSINEHETALVGHYNFLSADYYVFSNVSYDYSGYGYYRNSFVVDAEKDTGRADNNLCWAGAASNLLALAGWTTDSLQTEDDLLDYFRSYYIINGMSKGGFTWRGIIWYLTGYASFDTYKLSGGGGFFKSVAIDNVLECYSFLKTGNDLAKPVTGGDIGGLQIIEEALKNDYAVGVDFGWFSKPVSDTILSEGQRNGGHAITLYGLTYDNRYDASDPRHYTGIVVADSDDDDNYANARQAPNRMRVIRLFWDDATDCYFCRHGDGYGRLETFTILKTYSSESTNKQQNSDGVYHKTGGANLTVKTADLEFAVIEEDKTKCIFSIVPNGEKVSTIRATDPVFATIQIVNSMDGAIDDFNVDFSIDGTLCQSISVSGLTGYEHQDITNIYLGVFDAGMHKLTISIDPDGVVSEMNKKNNLLTMDFYVAEQVYNKTLEVTKNTTVSGTIVSAGQCQIVDSLGKANDTVVNQGGVLLLRTGANAQYAQVHGTLELSGGSAYSPTIYKNGLMYLNEKSIVNNLIVKESASVVATDNATLVSATINSKSILNIIGRAKASDVTLSGGSAVLSSGGSILGIDIHNGWLTMGEDSIVKNARISSGGTANITGGRLESGVVWGTLDIQSAEASELDLRKGGTAVIMGDGAQLNSASIAGSMQIVSSGRVLNTIITSGGILDVDGGIALNTNINQNGRMNIASDGMAMDVHLNGGAELYLNGGTVSGISLQDGAYLYGIGTEKNPAMLMDLDVMQDANVSLNGYTLLGGVNEIYGTLNLKGTTVGHAVGIDGSSPILQIHVGNDGHSSDDPYIQGFESLEGVTMTLCVETDDNGVFTIASEASVPGDWKLSTADGLLFVETLSVDTPIESNGTVYELFLEGNTLKLCVAGKSGACIWEGSVSGQYVLTLQQLGQDGQLVIPLSNTKCEFFLGNGAYQWRVCDETSNQLLGEGQFHVSLNEEQIYARTQNTGMDVFLAQPSSLCNSNYVARHEGNLYQNWEGTKNEVELVGKNQYEDIFDGLGNASLICLTDDSQGDALFLDDIFSPSWKSFGETQGRISRIDEIRAGDGDDIIDLTSQRFEYIGIGMTIRGGSGDDVLWANKGDNILFGDAGDDHIVGASGNDVLAGGSGDDNLHGGGGEDIFAFGGNWGNDIVEQLSSGKITLWFDGLKRKELSLSSDNDGNAVLACTSGSVTLKGVGCNDLSSYFATGTNEFFETLSLRFGDDGSEQYQNLLANGAFDEFTSERIFEDKNRGILA